MGKSIAERRRDAVHGEKKNNTFLFTKSTAEGRKNVLPSPGDARSVRAAADLFCTFSFYPSKNRGVFPPQSSLRALPGSCHKFN